MLGLFEGMPVVAPGAPQGSFAPFGAPGTLAMVLVMLLATRVAHVGAADTGAGLAQRCVLPVYEPWLRDAALSELRPDVVTPHTPWARAYAGGELDVVVVAPRWTQRATVELQQRFDFDVAPVMAQFNHAWGDRNEPHYAWEVYGTGELVTERALAALQGARRPDVVVIGWMTCPAIPEVVEQAILDAVAEGAGLVIFNPRQMSPKLEQLIATCRAADAEAVHPVVDGIPTQHLPPLKRQDPRDLVGKGVRCHENDAGGRIVVVDYAPLPPTGPYVHVNCYLSPPGAEVDKAARDIHYDYYCSLAGRCVLWAADAMPALRLTGWDALRAQVSTAAGPASLGTLQIAPEARRVAGARAEITVRDAEGSIEHRATTAIGADGRLSVDVGRVKSGGHYVDVICRGADGRTLDWGSRHFDCDSGAAISAVTAASADGRSGGLQEPVSIEVGLSGNLADATLAVTVRDTCGRLLWDATCPAEPRVTLQADVSGALSIRCDVGATLRGGDRVLARRSTAILVRQPQPPSDRYVYAAWAGTNPGFIRRQATRVLAEQGITSGILGSDWDGLAALNARTTPYVTRHYPANGDEQGLCVREPCLTDPAFLAKEAAKLREQAQLHRHYSPLAYSLGDDQAMLLTGQDACVSPTCLQAFRAYLAGRYGDIAALNDSWATTYASFEEAMPVSLDDARASGRFPAWAEHRMYMDGLFVKVHRDAATIIRAVDPGARVGFEGPLLDDSWYGYDWKNLMGAVDLMAPYPNAWRFDIVRSFARPGLMSGGWYGGYAMYRSSDDARFYPWFLLFNGCNSYWFFCGYGWSSAGHPAQGLAPDLRVLPCLRDATAQVRRVQSGIDRLVLGARRATHGVAVYHSRTSVHAATVMPPVPTRDYDTDPKWSQYLAGPTCKWPMNIEANLRLLDDVGLSYVFVDGADIAAGALVDGGFRLLVMPLVHAMSPEEVDAVRAFVTAGGAVLADFSPAVFDGHVKLLDAGGLDDVFGVHRRGSAMTPLPEQMVAPADAAQAASVPMPVDTTVGLAGGAADLTTDAGTPLFIRHAFGAGRACLMNMSVQHHLTLRAAGRGGLLQAALAGWLADAGVVPDVRAEAVGEHQARVRVFDFHDGGARLVGLLRPHKRLLDEPDAFADREPRPFVLRLPGPGHVYDVIGRAYRGETDHLELAVPVATPFLFAVFPYRVASVAATVDQDGPVVAVDVAVNASNGAPGRHVVHMRVTDAAGRLRPEYERSIIAREGRASETLRLGLDDPGGQWLIEVEDVATGTRGEARLEIALPGGR